jgi:hypothetical protein
MRPSKTPMISIHAYEIRPRKDRRGVDLISDALPFGWLWSRRIAPESFLIARRQTMPARYLSDSAS